MSQHISHEFYCVSCITVLDSTIDFENECSYPVTNFSFVYLKKVSNLLQCGSPFGRNG